MTNDVTQLLQDFSRGDRTALDKLLPIVYNELRRLAAGLLKNERSYHTLQPTALVHEAYLKLVRQNNVEWESRAQFFALSAQVMRSILVDHARRNLAEKRGGRAVKAPLETVVAEAFETDAELIALDEALAALAQFDERKARIVELRYFGGLSLDEIAAVMNISIATIRREMRFAEAWLNERMTNPDS